MTLATESTLLLSKDHCKPTPLPWFQISITMLVQICEPICSHSIFPYITMVVSVLDIVRDDPKKVGYYSGLIESLFFATEALTIFQWSRLSDYIGRKPVMLLGLFGLSLSMFSFGLSRTFLGLVVSRCICGLLNGNIGVIKSVMGEMTDSTNRVEAISFMPSIWCAGVTIGPLLGGLLFNPGERFPNFFGKILWKDLPCLLPCLVVSSFVFLVFIVVLVFFKETLSKAKTPLASSEDSDQLLTSTIEEPLSLRQLLTRPVIISISNYASLAFLSICLRALTPLFFASPINIGGLGFAPATIGWVTSFYGISVGIFQALFFSRLMRHWGEKKLFIFGLTGCLPMFSFFPLMSYFAQKESWIAELALWVCVMIMVPLHIGLDMAFGCIFMYVTASAPRKGSLGATNGLGQTAVSIARAIGPAMVTSLFSVSAERRLLGCCRTRCGQRRKNNKNKIFLLEIFIYSDVKRNAECMKEE